jgi:hypothetical protein
LSLSLQASRLVPMLWVVHSTITACTDASRSSKPSPSSPSLMTVAGYRLAPFQIHLTIHLTTQGSHVFHGPRQSSAAFVAFFLRPSLRDRLPASLVFRSTLKLTWQRGQVPTIDRRPRSSEAPAGLRPSARLSLHLRAQCPQPPPSAGPCRHSLNVLYPCPSRLSPVPPLKSLFTLSPAAHLSFTLARPRPSCASSSTVSQTTA